MIALTTISLRVDEARMSVKAADGSHMPSFETACNLIWQSPDTVKVSMLNGEMPRSLLREFALKLDSLGVERVLAKRAEGRLLPRLFRPSARADGFLEMDVRAAMAYLHRPSQFGDL